MSDYKHLLLTILTQEHQLLSREVSSLTVMTTEGEITVLPNHIPLFTKLADGELVYRWKEGEKTEAGSFAVSGGFLDVNPNGTVTVLADYAIRSEDINVARVEEAKKAAEEAMRNKESEKQFRLAEAALRRTLNELRIAEKIKVRRSVN